MFSSRAAPPGFVHWCSTHLTNLIHCIALCSRLTPQEQITRSRLSAPTTSRLTQHQDVFCQIAHHSRQDHSFPSHQKGSRRHHGLRQQRWDTIFPHQPTATRPLGIYGAKNSTGVYFACDDHYCFAAHIQCFVYDPKTSTVRYKVSKFEGQNLEQNVFRRFKSRLGLMNMDDTRAINRSYATRTLLMVNPDMYHADGSEQVGVYVAKAVRTYLMFKEDDHPVDTKHSGFMLQHLQAPYLLPLEAEHRSGGGKPAELPLFNEIEEFDENNDDWTIVVNAREDWEGKD